MMTFGRFRLSVINHGFLRLDGGAMFGTVPKAVWSRVMPADDENRVLLATRSLLIEGENRVVMIDAGTGGHWPAKFRLIYGIEHISPRASGLDPEKITDLVISHLHFDHAGGIFQMKAGVSPEIELSYPRARIHVQAANIETARHPNPREKASYTKETLDALDRSDLRRTSGSQEIFRDIWVHRSDGHTRGLQWIEIRDGAASAVYPSDLIPFSHHVALPYTMGYDINAEKLLEEKENFLSRAAAKDWLVVFEHDPNVPAAHIQKDATGRYAVRDLVEI
jgi:glyoxylase-like metal-dependent hydrolase (beta-lactamase superfamily II)